MLFVRGLPRPQGSKNAYQRGGRIILVESAKGLQAWRELIGLEYQVAKLPYHAKPMAVTVDLLFCLPQIKRPKLRYPTVKPDADKLARACLDALSGIAYEDDAQVCKLTIEKVYTWGEPGVYITVMAINNDLITTRKE